MSTSESQKQFEELVEDIGVTMMTTRSRDNHLRSRAMANQRRAVGADLWFVTEAGSAKLDDLAFDPHINLTYYKNSSREWISVAGTALISRDREKIRELYEPDWKMWFNAGDDPRFGTADDPRLVLIGVQMHEATFYAVDKPIPVVLFELAKGWVTGKQPDIGEVQTITSTIAKS
jgi:general stress protein 26